MNVAEGEVKKWGNSLGMILSREVVEREHLSENKKIKYLIIKDGRKVLREMFGIAKGKLHKSAQQMKDEIRAELYND